MKRSTLFFRDQNPELGKTLADWGGPELTPLPGGVEVKISDAWYGAVGSVATLRSGTWNWPSWLARCCPDSCRQSRVLSSER